MKTWKYADSTFHIYSKCAYFEIGLRGVIAELAPYLYDKPIKNVFFLYLTNKEDVGFFIQKQRQLHCNNIRWVIFADNKLPVYRFFEKNCHLQIINTSFTVMEMKSILKRYFKQRSTALPMGENIIADHYLTLLSPLECIITKGILQGLSGKEISESECRSPKTISHYKRQLLKKLNIKNLSSLNWLSEQATHY